MLRLCLIELHRWIWALEILDDSRLHSRTRTVPPSRYSLRDEVFYHLMLTIDGYTFSAVSRTGNAVALPVEAELDAMVDEPFPFEAVADTGCDGA